MSISTRFHWDEDRDYILVEDYIYDRRGGDKYVIEAMKYWLEIPEAVTVNEQNMLRCYDKQERSKRYEILLEYVEEMGDEYGFDDWYRDRYQIDEEDDRAKNEGDGVKDDAYMDDWMHSDRLAGDGRF